MNTMQKLSLLVLSFFLLGLSACDKPCDGEKETLVFRPNADAKVSSNPASDLDVLRKRLASYPDACATVTTGEGGKVEFNLLPGNLKTVDELAKVKGKFDILPTFTYREMEPFMAAVTTRMVTTEGQEEARPSFLNYLRPTFTIDPESPFLGEVLARDMYPVRELLKQEDSLLMSMGATVMLTYAEDLDGEFVCYLVGVKRPNKKEYVGQHIMESFIGGTDEKPAVRVALDAKGAQTLRKLTEGNLERSIAMVVDGGIWQTPTIRSPLIEGKFELTGGLNKEVSEILAAVLNGGEIKVPLELVQD